MRKAIFLPLFVCALLCLQPVTHAQTPNAIAYQAVARNASGNLLQNQAISLRFSILSGSANGTLVYQETDTATTNYLGLFTVSIGAGTPLTGTFGGIDWGGGPKFTRVEMDPAGGTNYVNMGTTQMLSVPYALYAAKSGSSGYTAGTGISISGTTIANTAPADTVTLAGGGATSVSGSYPNFTISTPAATSYWALSGGNLYNDSGSFVGIGTPTPTNALEVNGTTKTTNFQLTSGADSGYVLQSDAHGLASWVNPLTGGGAIHYVGTSYLGINSGPNGTGTSEGTGTNLGNINIGSNAGYTNTTGTNNIALGNGALQNNDQLQGMIAIGTNTLSSAFYQPALPGGNAIAIGTGALNQSPYPLFVTAVGYQSQYLANGNAAGASSFGYQSLRNATSFPNDAFGYQALKNGSDQQYNAAFGYQGLLNSNGYYNTALGYQAGQTINTGNNNTFVGARADASSASLTNATAIGYNTKVSASNSVILGNGANVGIGTSAPTQTLQVVGTTGTTNFQMTNGADSGYVLQSDASGNGSWVNPATGLGALRLVGTSYLGINSGPNGTGNSEGTGSNLGNINIGSNAGYTNTTGTNNIALGNGALQSNDQLHDIIAIGNNAFNQAVFTSGEGGSYSIAIGTQALANAENAKGCIAIGYQSQYSSNGSVENASSFGALSLRSCNSLYPNDAFGYQALENGSSEAFNAAFGYQSLLNSNGSYNIAMGYQAGKTINGGSNNTFLGTYADASSGSLTNATAIGFNAQVSASNSLVLGNGANVGIGTSAPTQTLQVIGTTGTTNFQMTNGAASGYVLQSDASGNGSWVSTSGSYGGVRYVGTSYLGAASGPGGTGTSEGTGTNLGNINIGSNAGYTNTTGTNNIALGNYALQYNNSTSGQIAIGDSALNDAEYSDIRTTDDNVAIGRQALYSSSGAFYPVGNVAIGYQSQQNAPTYAGYSTSVGYQTLMNTTLGDAANSAFGYQALMAGGSSFQNAAFGYQALKNSNSSQNTAVGYKAGVTSIQGEDNTFLGANADASSSNLDNATAIGFNAQVSASNSLVLGNGANVGIGTSAPTQTLQVIGTTATTNFQMTNGAASGYVLQSDAGGNGSWVNPSTGLGALRYVGTSYLGVTSGQNGNGTSEGTGSNLGNINIGSKTGFANTTGTNNIALGNGALQNNDQLHDVIAIGNNALNEALYVSETAGHYAIAIGTGALGQAAYPLYATAVGYQSQYSDGSTVVGTSSFGYQSLRNMNSSFPNDAFGYQALQNGSTEAYNAAFGYQGLQNSNGHYNTALGYQAGQTINAGGNNTFVGANADASTSGLNNATAIGYNTKVSASNSLVLGNNANVGIGTSAPSALLSVGSSSQFQVNSSGAIAAATGITSSGTVSFTGGVNAGSSSQFQVNSSGAITAATGVTSSGTVSLTGTATVGSPGTGLNLSVNGGMDVDNSGANSGSISSNAIQLGGTTSGEGIASQRTSGTNQYGLDLYTAGNKRVSVLVNGNVGVGTSSPASQMDISGATGFALSEQGGSAQVTLDNTATVWYFTGSAPVVLPAASSCANRLYTIVNRSTNARAISSFTSLSGAATTSLAPNTSFQIISDGTNWLQIK